MTYRESLEKKLVELDPMLLTSVLGQQALEVLLRAIAEAQETEQRLQIERERHQMDLRERQTRLRMGVLVSVFAMVILAAKLLADGA